MRGPSLGGHLKVPSIYLFRLSNPLSDFTVLGSLGLEGFRVYGLSV